MTTFLLDANVLIALMAREHIHHSRVATWSSTIDAYLVALAAARPDARLATLDEALVDTWPEVAFLVPHVG